MANNRDLIGFNVHRWRTAAGMTQQDVADAAGLTKQYVSAIELGKRPVTKRTTLADLARALKVSVTDLTGQPYQPTTRPDLDIYRMVPRVRAALDEPDEPIIARPMAQLELAADRAMAARMECDVPALGQHLPDLLAETRLLWFERGDRAAGVLLVKAAVTGALALKSAGFVDLGVRLAELADQVAGALGDPVCLAAARFAAAQCALSAGSRRRSARLAVAAAEDMDRLTRTKLPPAVLSDVGVWLGLLHLHAGLSVAGLAGGDADMHLAEAQAAAARVTSDAWRMEFTPANVATWAVGIALENGHPERAPELARRVDPNDLLTPQRRSRLYLDTGRGHFATGDNAAAVRALLAADRAAPGDLRSRAPAVEIVAHLVREAPRRSGSAELRDLALRVGVNTLAPPDA